jgi:hypothetical protein
LLEADDREAGLGQAPGRDGASRAGPDDEYIDLGRAGGLGDSGPSGRLGRDGGKVQQALEVVVGLVGIRRRSLLAGVADPPPHLRVHVVGA